MPDISMCSHRVCPQRLTCYRWRAVPSEFRQAFGDFAPRVPAGSLDLWPLTVGALVRKTTPEGKLMSETGYFGIGGQR